MGAGAMVNDCVAVAVPHSLVTTSVIEFAPGVLKVTGPGLALVAVAGMPPVKVHE